MQNSAPNHAQLLDARREFLSRGVVENGKLPQEIARSWQRCLDNGMEVGSQVRTEILTRQELLLKQEANHLLLAQARPEMDSLNEQISHTRSVIVLTDHEALFLIAVAIVSFWMTASA
ncbi:hypothetical protein [Methylobacillus glycogenes]|uniref:hypothetical protein n=1 Tax=Methylobacillus glycogenes TaxID=406 RepID=UPI001F389F94|nr:hypothetical protein [Methylobacillus glycogenes]